MHNGNCGKLRRNGRTNVEPKLRNLKAAVCRRSGCFVRCEVKEDRNAGSSLNLEE